MPKAHDNRSVKPLLSGRTPVSTLKGIGPKRSATLSSAGIHTVEDLLFHFPLRYEDRRTLSPISSLQPGMQALVKGIVVHCELNNIRRRRMSVFKATIQDKTGTLDIVWFNQPWLADKISNGKEFLFFGMVEQQNKLHALSMNSPQVISGKEKEERRVVPVYSRIRDITPWIFRNLIEDILTGYQLDLSVYLPESQRKSEKLLSTDAALRYIHRPPTDVDLNKLEQRRDIAHRSLIFAEFFAVQAGLALMKRSERTTAGGIEFKTSPKIRETLKKMLPFTLTNGQREAFKEIVGDMTAPAPMRRLLQGDVGSGKTIVALLAAALAIENGYQAVFMAPTEILAEQHIQTIQQHCGHTGFRTAFLTGSLASGERRRVRQQIADGEADLIVGTHALVQEGVSFKKLGLAVIDEQHRFGVMQRAALLEAAAGITPDLLIMTATPIPRSLTLTLFGDLNVSLISDKPPGRKPVTTAVRLEKDKPKIISFLKKETAAGRQVYWVCSRIADNPDDDIKGVEEVYQQLRKIFGPQRVGLLHGKLPQREREEMMARFLAGEIKVLAATTVIEVGVNVPNASVMLIENAERFGLSQLHQLRGRVGRGADKSWCILIYNPTASENAAERLKTLEDSDDGFEIAQKDLELRGPGDFFGTRQSGVPTFRVGSLIRDAKLLEEAREKAFSYIASPPRGLEKERSNYIDHLRHQWKQKYGLVLVG